MKKPDIPKHRKAKTFSVEDEEGLPFKQFHVPKHDAAVYVRVSTQD